MVSVAKVHYPVVSGPSKWDLSLALFDRSSSSARKVLFGMKFNDRVADHEVQVNSVEAEDGSGESWNITGYATLIAGEGPLRGSVPRRPRHVSIYFRTDNRKGSITFLD